MNDSKLLRTSIIVGILLSVVMIANTALSTYVLYTTSFTASMAPENGEQLDIAVKMDTGRPTLVESIIDRARNLGSWFAGWKVDSVDKTQLTLAVSISLTGSNAQSAAQVDYYIKAVDNDNSQNWHKTLIAENQSITVGGTALTADITKDIGQHMIDIGLADEQTHTVKYYIWIQATTTGTISGETLTCTVTETLFDTITYTYEAAPVETQILTDKDTYISNDSGDDDENYGSSIYLVIAQETGGQKQHTLIEWDINGLPEQATIQDATISLYNKYPDKHGWNVYRSLATFTESTVTYNSGTPDLTTTNLAEKYEDNDATAHWFTVTVTDQFDDAYNGGSGTYYGIRITSDQYGSDVASWCWSSDYNAAYKPRLDITYLAYQASWYPVSVTSLRPTMDMAAYLAILITIGVILIMKNKENKTN